MNKNSANRNIFETLSFSMSILDSFRLNICIYLFYKHTGKQSVFLVDHFQRSNPQSLSEISKKKCLKSLKINFALFVVFDVNLRNFHFEKCNKLFGKDYWTTNFFPCWPFKTFQFTKSIKNLTLIAENSNISSEMPAGQRINSMLDIFSVLKKLHKLIKIGEFLVFCYFPC